MAVTPDMDELAKNLDNSADDIEKLQIANTQKMREDLNLARRTSWERSLSDKLENERFVTDIASGKRTDRTLWGVVSEKADAAINSDQNAYNDFRSAITSIVNMYAAYLKASDNSLHRYALPFLLMLKHGTYDLAKDGLKGLFSLTPEEIIPALQHFVSLEPNGKLKIELTCSDNDQMMRHLEGVMKQGVELWLKENNYKPNPQKPGTYIDQNNVPLDAEKFNQLKADPVNGLEKFLSRLPTKKMVFESVEPVPSSISGPKGPN